MKKLIAIVLGLFFTGIAGMATFLVIVSANLPQLITVADYEPLLVSEVYARGGEKIGEFFREKRILVPYNQIPSHVVNAFLAAEDSSFFKHGGINYTAVARAFVANLRAGRKVQGGSTITQQVARTLLLSPEKTYIRKIREILLAYRMEANLSKEDILYLYLNQIYLGQGAYGVGVAAQVYFRKPVQELTVGEAALLAGMPQAPSRYSPLRNSHEAKDRQLYVIRRMQEEGFLNQEQADQEGKNNIVVYTREDFQKVAPYYLETIRQLLVAELGETMVLEKGLRIETSLDFDKQMSAQEEVRKGLRDLDKREGWRGPQGHIEDSQQATEFLLNARNELIDEKTPQRIILADGSVPSKGPLNLVRKDENKKPLPVLPEYIGLQQILKGLVTRVEDRWGLVYVRFAESQGIIDIDSMKWARAPNPNVPAAFDEISKPSKALKRGDVIWVRVAGPQFASERLAKIISELQKQQNLKNKKSNKNQTQTKVDSPEIENYAQLELEQEPQVEGALISVDQETSDVLALVGGYDFERSKFNRALQALRQPGSSFKAIVYASALDNKFTPVTPILDAPIVFEEHEEGQENSEEIKKWKPLNHSKSFAGDILFRNALIASLNIPTVKIVEKLGVKWVAEYAKRLGVFSPLNMDFTIGLGSSGITLYEMTKVFAHFGRLGKKLRPLMVRRVLGQDKKVLTTQISLDDKFKDEISKLDQYFEEKRKAYLTDKPKDPEAGKEVANEAVKEAVNEGVAQVSTETNSNDGLNHRTKPLQPQLFFDDPDQVISPTTAYLISNLLYAAVNEKGGTGGAARALDRAVAGKTGTSNNYFDAWFIGYTPQIVSGVWVGFDGEQSLGKGEVGARAALPIWLEYMKTAHQNLPEKAFVVPPGIVFANIDNKTGKLASAQSQNIVRQAFREGTEPQETSDDSRNHEDAQQFYKEDLSE